MFINPFIFPSSRYATEATSPDESSASIFNNYSNGSIYFVDNYELTDDLTINADCKVSNSLDLKGHTLEVKGNTFVEGGCIRISKGQLICKNNLTCELSYWNRSYIAMTNEEDYAVVHGNFTYRSYWGNSELYAGELELKGDFIHEVTSSPDNFTATGTHKVIFSGNKNKL